MISTDITELQSGEYPAYTIYSLVNLKNQKRYIGRSKNPRQRIKQHFINLKSHNHPNKLINADSDCEFGYEILETSVPIAFGKKKEREYIERFKTYESEYGYNGKDHCVSTITNPKYISTKTIFYEELSVNTKKIRRLRKQQGLTLAELAELIGAKSRASAYHYENEKRDISFCTLNKIAKALNCSPLSLIEIKEIEQVEK